MARRRHAHITKFRKRAEVIHENIRFQHTIRNARDRATLRTEQARLHSMMYEQIAPQLRERVQSRRENISQMMAP